MSIGPVEYVIISFPENRFDGRIAPALDALAQSGTVRIIDIVFITKTDEGQPIVLDAVILARVGVLGEQGVRRHQLQGGGADRDEVGVVVGNEPERVVILLARLEREIGWDAILAANGDHSRAKPNPVLYLEALELLGVRQDEAVVFEDSPNGVRAGKAAGIFTVGIPNAVTKDYGLDEADLIVESLADLPPDELLARFN